MGQSPFAKSLNAASSPINRRRSTRIEYVAPIAISGRDATGQPFREETETIMVSAHGANFKTRARLLIGMQLTVVNLLEGIAERAICIRVAPPEHPEDPQIVAIQLVIPRNVWGMKDPPADWQHAMVAESPEPHSAEVLHITNGSIAKGLSADATSNAGLERGAADITESALQEMRRQASLIMQDSLKEFERNLKALESAAEARLAQGSNATSSDAEKSLDHLLCEFLEELTVRSKQVAAESEEDLRQRMTELLSPFLKMTSEAGPGKKR
ncbi:MAG TPA: hypothetical protein VKV95_06860 [Terriglobia bacterium]|nr:hypothetical protein [Terriglobia bacterium]